MPVQKPSAPAPPRSTGDPTPPACPLCGAATEQTAIGGKVAWTCAAGGLAHYYQARYGHLKGWFTTGEGNLREPVIRAMNCAA